MRTHTHTHTHACMHAHAYTHTHMHTHTHTHTHMHMGQSSVVSTMQWWSNKSTTVGLTLVRTWWRTVFQFFKVNTCTDSLLSVSPSGGQHTLGRLAHGKDPMFTLEKRRPYSWLHGNRQIAHNSHRIIKMRTVVATPNGRRKKAHTSRQRDSWQGFHWEHWLLILHHLS